MFLLSCLLTFLQQVVNLFPVHMIEQFVSMDCNQVIAEMFTTQNECSVFFRWLSQMMTSMLSRPVMIPIFDYGRLKPAQRLVLSLPGRKIPWSMETNLKRNTNTCLRSREYPDIGMFQNRLPQHKKPNESCSIRWLPEKTTEGNTPLLVLSLTRPKDPNILWRFKNERRRRRRRRREEKRGEEKRRKLNL
eukprot:Lithocolla_globosa_v1_NODE_4238_length_1481_cov_4.805750.p2 type:complete len:190 gc:universal NODE_4238_length_1481_cov_4.805750:886-317(-)